VNRAKEIALDTEEVSSDNLNVWGSIYESMVSSFSEKIINYMNQKIRGI
jgi:hypothetical protein